MKNQKYGILLLILSISVMVFPVSAQIKINDSGKVGIGDTPQSQSRLNVICDGCVQFTGYGIRTHLKNVSTAYGVWSRAEGTSSTRAIQGLALSDGHFAYGVYATANSANAVHNYGIRAAASNATSANWAGWFSGDLYSTGSYQGSDERFKQEIQTLDGSDILDKIQQIQPRSYRILNETELNQANMPVFGSKEGVQLGLIAQELEAVFPELVIDVLSELDDGTEMMIDPEEIRTVMTKAVNYNGLIPVLIAGIQEQQQQIMELEARLAALENMMRE